MVLLLTKILKLILTIWFVATPAFSRIVNDTASSRRPTADYCVLPPYPEHGSYTTNIKGSRPGSGYKYFSLEVTCQRGYGVIGSASVSCQDGVWREAVPKCVQCGRVTASGTELVAGGHNAKKGELPWHAGVYRKTYKPYMQICGGSLISENVVLSAAHCFYSERTKKLPADQFAIAVGKIYRPWNDPNDDEAQISDVKEIHLTEHYQGTAGNFQDDIAIVIVTEPFQYKTFIRPVCLDFDKVFEQQQLQASNKGKVAGWGLTEENGKPVSVLQVVDLPYVDVATCIENSPSDYTEYITSDKICAGSLDNTTALCHGGSGGGLAFPVKDFGIERFYLRGVASIAPTYNVNHNGCTTFAYTGFTQITKHEAFIKQYWTQA